MLRPYTEILIGDNSIAGFAQSITIESKRNQFTDKATIVLTNNIPDLGKKVSDTFKLGDPVQIYIAYFPNSSLRFKGYVSEIIPDRTCTIVCEDESYIYKRETIGKNIVQKNTTTTALFNAIYPGEKKIFDAKIGDWRISKDASLLDVLNKIRQKFSVYSYWRDGKLVVGGGFAENDTEPNVITADFQGNVPEGESSLSFKQTSADKTIVKGESLKRNGEKIIVYGTYGQGNEVILSDTLPANGKVISTIKLGENDQIDKETLQETVTRKLNAISYNGLNGSVVIYGEPKVIHGDLIKITDVTRPEIDGQYKCVGVITSYSTDNGFRQTLELGLKISD